MHIRQVTLKMQLNIFQTAAIRLLVLFELPRDDLGFAVVDSNMTAFELVARVSLKTPPQRAVTVHIEHTSRHGVIPNDRAATKDRDTPKTLQILVVEVSVHHQLPPPIAWKNASRYLIRISDC